MEKTFRVRCSTVGLDLLEGEIMTSYNVEAANETDAKKIAKDKFREQFPLTEKTNTYILKS